VEGESSVVPSTEDETSAERQSDVKAETQQGEEQEEEGTETAEQEGAGDGREADGEPNDEELSVGRKGSGKLTDRLRGKPTAPDTDRGGVELEPVKGGDALRPVE